MRKIHQSTATLPSLAPAPTPTPLLAIRILGDVPTPNATHRDLCQGILNGLQDFPVHGGILWVEVGGDEGCVSVFDPVRAEGRGSAGGRRRGEKERGGRTHRGSAPASKSISTTPCLAPSCSNFTATCKGVEPSSRFCRSTSVPVVVHAGQRREERGKREEAHLLARGGVRERSVMVWRRCWMQARVSDDGGR